MEEFGSLEELVAALRERQVREVAVTGKVATTTSPGGGQVVFRGRLVVCADLGRGRQECYTEHVMPYVTETEAPEMALLPDHAADLRAAQRSLARQLRAYRHEYQAVMEAARAALADRLARAGVEVTEPEG